ncbi:MAG: Na+/H+ antiporter subunit E [Candidatus Binatia bacterium]|nr:Na+/H+ antiporter subunit E [Candidatus Binatia bacterium]
MMALLHLLLAVLWVALTGQWSLSDLTFGWFLAYGVLWLTHPHGEGTYFARIPRVFRALLAFLWEIVLANLRVTYHVFAPLERMRPGIVAVPLEVQSDAAITMLANAITLTPGTLSLDVSSDRQILYVHGMRIADPVTFRAEIKSVLERHVKEVLE